jgi:hypothetical protein
MRGIASSHSICRSCIYNLIAQQPHTLQTASMRWLAALKSDTYTSASRQYLCVQVGYAQYGSMGQPQLGHGNPSLLWSTESCMCGTCCKLHLQTILLCCLPMSTTIPLITHLRASLW